MNVTKVILVTTVVAVGLVWAAKAGDTDTSEPRWKGSIQVSGQHTQGALAKMAKIGRSRAEMIALRNVGDKDSVKAIVECELEVEDGYLVYSVEVKLQGQEGVEEILIDAGTGKVLAREHETEDGEESEVEDHGDEGADHGDDDDEHEDSPSGH